MKSPGAVLQVTVPDGGPGSSQRGNVRWVVPPLVSNYLPCSSPPSWYYLQMPVRCLCSPLDRGQPPPQPGSLLFLVWAPGHSQMGTLTRQRSLWTCPAQDFGSFMLMATASGGCFCLRGYQLSADHSRSPLHGGMNTARMGPGW